MEITPNTITFNFTMADGLPKEVGRLYIKENKLHFEGDVDKSAQVFFDNLSSHLTKKLKDYENCIKFYSSDRCGESYASLAKNTLQRYEVAR